MKRDYKYFLLKCFVLVVPFIFFVSSTYGNGDRNDPGKNIVIPKWERLEYGLYWFHIPAGSATLEVTDGQEFDGQEVFRLVSTAQSNAFVSIFYPVDDFVESFFDAEEFYSHGINLHLREGRKKKNRKIRFDYVRGQAIVFKEKETLTFHIPGKIQDVLSSLYYLRVQPVLVPGKTVKIPVHDGGKNRTVEAQILNSEWMETSLGRQKTLKVGAHMHFDGLFFNEGDVFVWLTDDEKRIPVMMKTKVRIGSVTAELLSEKRKSSPLMVSKP